MSQEPTKIEVEDELERFMALHGFSTIDEIKKLATEELLKMDGFGFRLLNYLFNSKKI